MPTRQQIKNIAVNAIQKGFLEQITPTTIPSGIGGLTSELHVSASNYETFVDHQSGQLTTGTSNDSQQIVLYQEDYQHAQSNFNTFIDKIADCYKQSNSNVYDDFIPTFGTSNEHFVYAVNDAEIAFQSNNAEDGTTCTAPAITLVDALSSLAQFQSLENISTTINRAQAQEVLDTTIFELLPQQTSKQDKIDQFFIDYSNLKGDYPSFNFDLDGDGTITDSDATDSEGGAYSQTHDINSTNNPQGFIPRLNSNAELINSQQTLEWLRDDLNTYFYNSGEQTTEDFLEYKERSNGYLKFRNLNQAIIIRNSEGRQVIPNDWETTGFTIAKWVRFKDKVSDGTLFNYGNPLRATDPLGFMLETYILNANENNKDGGADITSDGYYSNWKEFAEYTSLDYFDNNDQARFVRLVVNSNVDKEGNPAETSKLYDSHIAIANGGEEPHNGAISKAGNISSGETSIAGEYSGAGSQRRFLAATNVPIDFNEWYFIVATYNPINNETIDGDNATIPLYWTGNAILDDGTDTINTITHNSGLGNKCKVEIISKTDLLRARGFKL